MRAALFSRTANGDTSLRDAEKRLGSGMDSHDLAEELARQLDVPNATPWPQTIDLLNAQLWWWGALLLVFGLATALFGVIFATVQNDMKRLLAYSSID